MGGVGAWGGLAWICMTISRRVLSRLAPSWPPPGAGVWGRVRVLPAAPPPGRPPVSQRGFGLLPSEMRPTPRPLLWWAVGAQGVSGTQVGMGAGCPRHTGHLDSVFEGANGAGGVCDCLLSALSFFRLLLGVSMGEVGSRFKLSLCGFVKSAGRQASCLKEAFQIG